MVAETQSSSSGFDLLANSDASGFKIEQTIIEAKGLCQTCAEIE